MQAKKGQICFISPEEIDVIQALYFHRMCQFLLLKIDFQYFNQHHFLCLNFSFPPLQSVAFQKKFLFQPICCKLFETFPPFSKNAQ